MTESITCPVCRMTSYNPNDVQYGYCGHCHAFTRERNQVDRQTAQQMRDRGTWDDRYYVEVWP